jgi:hypothetical protein
VIPRRVQENVHLFEAYRIATIGAGRGSACAPPSRTRATPDLRPSRKSRRGRRKASLPRGRDREQRGSSTLCEPGMQTGRRKKGLLSLRPHGRPRAAPRPAAERADLKSSGQRPIVFSVLKNPSRKNAKLPQARHCATPTEARPRAGRLRSLAEFLRSLRLGQQACFTERTNRLYLQPNQRRAAYAFRCLVIRGRARQGLGSRLGVSGAPPPRSLRCFSIEEARSALS